jgi:hypothetical protein
VTAVNPTVTNPAVATDDSSIVPGTAVALKVNVPGTSRVISLKAMTLNNNKQKINDALGNPVEIGAAQYRQAVSL